ncbi:MAG: FAD-dependent oxidoreductase [Bacteroidia bacterium]|jgi:tryptophan 2-monooxygenase|nr:FAD-dependent oxidoreductase [Bacteroidia bacterium]
MYPFIKTIKRPSTNEKSTISDNGIVDGRIVELQPFCQIDVPNMDYQQWLNASVNQLADLSKQNPNAKIAIIGAGMSGLITGFELLRAGFTNFTIYEAGDRVGGRFFSYPFPNDSVNKAELGAMRFPPTESCLYWYIKYLQDRGAKIVLDPDFPDPGLVPTMVMYKGQNYLIEPNGDIPAIFKDIHDSWNGFVTTTEQIILANGVTLDSPASMSAWLNVYANTYDPIRAQNAWQAWVNYFKDKSFIQGVIEIFCQPNAPKKYDSITHTFGERYQWKYPEDIEKFGTVGTGIGGQSPLFSESFICLMRFTINQLEDKHALIVTGTDSVANALASLPVLNGIALNSKIKLNTAINQIIPTSDGKTVSLLHANGSIIDSGINHLVIATTNRAAEVGLGIDSLWQNNNPSASKVIGIDKREALSNVHMAQSSKFFLKVKPWWLGDSSLKKVRCITTDTAMANFYTLDYDPNDEYAVCLMNYVWEDLSEMSESLGNINERYQRFLRDLKQIPDIQYILDAMPAEVNDENAVMIDWQTQPYFNGAFSLTQATQEDYLSKMYYNFMNPDGDGSTAKVYFVGDSVSWVGGWVEGALTTGLNAFSAIVKDLGGKFTSEINNPFLHLNAKSILYDNTSATGFTSAVGPFGGCSTQVTPISEEITPTSAVFIYYDASSRQGVINGLTINGNNYGTCSRNLTKVQVDLNTPITSVSIIACKEIDANGRLRGFKLNDNYYGASPDNQNDILYSYTYEKPMQISSIKGMFGVDIDRIGFNLKQR